VTVTERILRLPACFLETYTEPCQICSIPCDDIDPLQERFENLMYFSTHLEFGKVLKFNINIYLDP